MSGAETMASSREKILDAAVQVAIRDGILAMTLDAVAAETGISKGGLIYHFKNKDDLIAAMLEHFREQVQRSFESRIAADDHPQGRWFRAFVKTVFGAGPSGDPAVLAPSEMARFLTAMLTASANNPQLLGPIRDRMSQLRERLLAEGPNGLRQIALWPAVYGLILWQHLGILTGDDPLRQSLIDELLTLAEGPDPSLPKE
jgi:AcrR family transcriptional regulator